ncbi:MAG TPA: CPBP family glutamic-type intramembrane protease [Polyangiaceae bacterium]|jgi:membrane protease YdiL (CAAX protease family)
MSDWRTKADEAFLVGMPSRWRIVLEMILLVALVFAANAFVVSMLTAIIVVGVELALALALVRPWARVHGGVVSRVLSTVLVVLAVVAPAAIERPDFGASRRLGVGVANGTAEPGDPPIAGGIVNVESVSPRSPADGVLRAGDRIVGLGGAPLDRADATSDLTRRTHGDDLPEDTTVTVLRAHAEQTLPVHIPKVAPRAHFDRRLGAVRELAARHLVVAAAARGALVIGLLLLLLRADGQSAASIGLVRAGASRELLAAVWITVGTFFVQIVVAIPIGIIGMMLGILNRENEQRTQTLGAIAQQGSIVEFALAAIVAAAFEEIAFRGFLVPRMKTLVRSWVLAVFLVSVIFGAGHVYEGILATIQTAFLGAWFAATMLARRRLIGPITAHAAFNTIMLIVIRVVTTTHIVDRLKTLAPH